MSRKMLPLSDTQQIGDAIVLNRQRRDQYLILSKLAKGASGSASRIHSILNELETQELSLLLYDTHRIGDAIIIRYSTDGDAIDRQGNRWDMIDIWCSTTVLRVVQALESPETRSLPDTQQIVGVVIDTQQIGDASNIRYSTNLRRRHQYSILNKYSETSSIFDAQQVFRDVIDIQYCLAECKRLGDDQINI